MLCEFSAADQCYLIPSSILATASLSCPQITIQYFIFMSASEIVLSIKDAHRSLLQLLKKAEEEVV